MPPANGNNNGEQEQHDTSSFHVSTDDPPYPPWAYYFQKDEDDLKYTFISFIDHFDESYSQVARLVEPRLYARAKQFAHQDKNTTATQSDPPTRMTMIPPTIDDVACPSSLYGPVANLLAWNRLPARIVVGTMAYFLFPTMIELLESYISADYAVQEASITTPQIVTASNDWWGQLTQILPHTQSSSQQATASLLEKERENLSALVNFYVPGASIVLGTYFSMTLSILYNRLSRLQQAVSLEASMLAFCFHVLLDLFAKDTPRLVQSVQCVADQIHVLVRESRGKETMRIMYNDPYANILRIIQSLNHERSRCQAQEATLVGVIRGCVKELFELRSKRMTDEALALAPTHFDILTFLSGLVLVGIALGTVATAQTNGVPTELSRVLFSALVVCYTTTYEMSYDLNRPFDGIYQIRRSGAAMHFLQIKQIVANHPILREKITFEPKHDGDRTEDVPPNNTVKHDRSIWYN